MLLLSTIFCFTVHFLTIVASSANSSHASLSGSCKLRDTWRKNLKPLLFDPTQDCRGLNEILLVVNQDKSFNFCAADPNVVLRYFNSSLLSLRPHNRPRPCEVYQWYYEDYGGKLKQPFCQNATEINVQVYTSKKPHAARTQPYETVFHGARTLCRQKFKSDLESMGDPDIAGIGVLTSEIFGMVLLLVFHLAALSHGRFHLAASLLKTIKYFYATATVLAFSIAIAAPITFWQRRSKSDLLYSNFGYFNFYANLTLALAPPLSVIPAVVLVLMPSEIEDKESREKINIWDKKSDKNKKLRQAQLAVILPYLLCVAVTWMIWSMGVKDQHYPTRIVFGGTMNFQVSHFLYRNGSTYILCVCILMVGLPAIGLGVWAVLRASHRIRHSDGKLQERLSVFRDRCRDVYLLFGISQLFMFGYIRAQAVHQAEGATSETDWGFGQILIMFTWLPLLYTIASKAGTELFECAIALGSWLYKSCKELLKLVGRLLRKIWVSSWRQTRRQP